MAVVSEADVTEEWQYEPRPEVIRLEGGPFWSREEAEQYATEDARPSYWEIVDVEDTDG